MVHRIALNFEDGVTRFIESRPDELVADAAYRAGLNIPLDCRNGACGTCKCRLVSGKIYELSDRSYALSGDELSQNYILACQSMPRSDLVDLDLWKDEA